MLAPSQPNIMPLESPTHRGERELIRKLYEGRYPVGLATVAVGMLFWGFLYWRLQDWHVIVWGLLQHAGVGVMLLWYRRFAGDEASPQRFDARMRELHGIQLASGLLWGFLPWLFLPPGDTMLAMLMVLVLTGVVSAGIAYLAMIRHGIFSFGAPIAICLLAALLRQPDDVHMMLAGFVLLHFATTAKLAVQQHEMMVQSLTAGFEKENLAAQLKHEKEIAEQANTAKSKFLAAASHDLRQPIHAQGLFLETLARTQLSPQQQELMASARAAAEASSELLNALLDFSRIEAGVVRPHLLTFRMQPLLNKIETELAPQADAKGIVYRTREAQIAVQSDPMLLELILRNLVSNAIRYTERGGILIGYRNRGDCAVLEVWDTGIGIAPEDQQAVFREFHQLGNPERDRRKGLGLGLAIADGLAQTLGHKLTLSSVPGKGSVFRIAVPISNTIESQQSAAMQSRTRLLNLSLLIIDDDEIVREGMLHLLRDWGCGCEAAESIEEALVISQRFTPDIIISDYRLREQRTGVEAIASLRGLLGESLPALLITGDTAPERLREAQTSGIPLLHKPVSPGKLYRMLVELQQTVA